MTGMASGARAIWICALALAAAALLAAPRMKESDLELLANWFGGVYDAAPVAGTTASDAHVLIIERVSSPMIGWHVFYVEERDAEGLVLAQQLQSFELAKDKKSIVERSFSFKESRRWQGGLQRPDIFKSMLADDLTVASGCEIFWIRDKQGFLGRTSAHACRLRVRATGASMQIDLATRLNAAEYVHGDRRFSKRAAGSE